MKTKLIFIMLAYSNLIISNTPITDIVGNRFTIINTIQREAHHTIWNTNSLTPEEMQLLLNVTCIAFAIVNAEHKLQEEANLILSTAWYFRYDQGSFLNNSSENLLSVERSLERFKNILKAKHILKQAQDEIEKQIRQPEHKALEAITDMMEKHAMQLITYFSRSQGAPIKQALTQCAENLSKIASILKISSESYQELIEDTYALKGQYNTELQTLEIIHHLAESRIVHQAKQIFKSTEYLAHTIKQIQEFGALVFYIYYKITYEGMVNRVIDEKYFSMIFDENCLISGKYRLHD
jgi:hypothetical protein